MRREELDAIFLSIILKIKDETLALILRIRLPMKITALPYIQKIISGATLYI